MLSDYVLTFSVRVLNGDDDKKKSMCEGHVLTFSILMVMMIKIMCEGHCLLWRRGRPIITPQAAKKVTFLRPEHSWKKAGSRDPGSHDFFGQN